MSRGVVLHFMCVMCNIGSSNQVCYVLTVSHHACVAHGRLVKYASMLCSLVIVSYSDVVITSLCCVLPGSSGQVAQDQLQ